MLLVRLGLLEIEVEAMHRPQLLLRFARSQLEKRSIQGDVGIQLAYEGPGAGRGDHGLKNNGHLAVLAELHLGDRFQNATILLKGFHVSERLGQRRLHDRLTGEGK